MGLAIADTPESKHVRANGERPILTGSHEVMIWPHREGVAAYASLTQSFEYAPDGRRSRRHASGSASDEGNTNAVLVQVPLRSPKRAVRREFRMPAVVGGKHDQRFGPVT